MILNENLCTLAGIHAADGHLTKSGYFSMKDEDITNLEIFVNLIKKEFKILPKIKKVKDENAYKVEFSNKDFCNFLNKDLDFPLGPKTYTTGMPYLFKGKEIFERYFIAGAMTFESSVNTNKSITFSVTSKRFRDDLSFVFCKNGLKIKEKTRIKEGNRKKQYEFTTSENLNSEEYEKWLDYFIKGSEKWFKLIEFARGFFGKVKNLDDAKNTFDLTYNKGKIIRISELIENIKKFNKTELMFLCKKLKCGKTTLIKYLRIFWECKIIKICKKILFKELDNFSEKTHITLEEKQREEIFNKINKLVAHDAEICRLLEIKDFTYCRWRNGERGIPINKLKLLLKLSNFNKEVYLNIKKFDREVIEFNNTISEWRVPWRPWLNNIKLDKTNKGVKKWIINL